MNRFYVLCSAITALLVMSCSNVAANNEPGQPKQAMFKTRAEAEAAAEDFGCTGAHQMGSMWMVCEHHKTTPHH